MAVGLFAWVGCARPRPRPLAPLPADATAAYLRGRVAFFEGDYELAVPELARAMAAAPDQAGIAIAHAQALARAGRRDEARAAIDDAVVRFPDSPEGWIVAGELRARAGDAVAAITAYRRARALDRGAVRAYLGLAAAYTQAGDAAAAERTYRELATAVPDAVDGHWRLARLALARGDDVEAAARLERTVALDRDHLEARRALAALRGRAGDWAAAVAAARASWIASGGDFAFAEDLCWFLLERGDRAGALEVLAGYDEAADDGLRLRLAELYLILGEPARSAAVAPTSAAGRLVAARAAWSQGRPAAAEALAAAVPPDDAVGVEAAAFLDELALASGRPPAPAAIAAAQRYPHAAPLVELAAERDRRAGAVAAGRARFVAAATARPRDPALAAAWARFESRAGAAARARALADKLVAATPGDVGARNLAGYLGVLDGSDLPVAGRRLAAARRDAPGDPYVLDSWAWYRRAVGDLAGADRASRRAVLIAPREPELVQHAITIAVERGDHARAALLGYRLLTRPLSPEVAADVRDQLARVPAAPCYAATAMRTTWLVRIALGSTLAVAACDNGPSKSDCEKLLDHLITLEAASGGAVGGSDKATKEQLDALKADVEKQKLAIRDYAIGQKFVETCVQRTPVKVVKCGLAAQNADELAACDK